MGPMYWCWWKPGNFFWGWPFCFPFLILVLLICLFFFLRRRERPGPASDTGGARGTAEVSPLDLVKHRYAKGEISRAEFETLKKDLSN
jgi:putative membrane protein|uniref:SHOCT domain-containing protein n=1 Tax=Desulfobacca acetoxidans TaxID=60893 RepID=A0A7C5EUD8_9BACT